MKARSTERLQIRQVGKKYQVVGYGFSASGNAPYCKRIYLKNCTTIEEAQGAIDYLESRNAR